jgi:antitoxin (DNA-binding transcriptional repressor) of toxin-antitoxin stability system
MKTIPVREAQGQLGQLVAEACRGELIVLTDGDKKVRLEPGTSLDLEQDSPELEAELLKAASGPFRPYREGDLRDIADRALRGYRAKRQQ